MSTLLSKMSLIAVLAGLLLSQQADAQTFYQNGEPYAPGRTSLLPPPRSSSTATSTASDVSSGSGAAAETSASGSTVISSEEATAEESSEPEVMPGDSTASSADEADTDETTTESSAADSSEETAVKEPAADDATDISEPAAPDAEASSSYNSIEDAFPEFADSSSSEEKDVPVAGATGKENDKTPPADSGLSLNTISMIILFVLALLGGIGYAIWRWRQNRTLYEVQPAPQAYIPGPWDDQKSKLQDAIDDMRNDYLS